MANNSRALIVTGGHPVEESLLRKLASSSQFVIAADGGIKNFLQLQDVKPNLIVGDFDSAPLSGWEELYQDIPKVTFPKEKDYTDTELAILEALKLPIDEIYLIGATGSRLDHTLANMMLLRRIERAGKTGIIIDEYNEIRQIVAGVTIVEKGEWNYMSLVPISERLCVSLKGFKYPLDRAVIDQASTVTISNEIIAEQGEIDLHEGMAFLILARD